MSNSKSLIQELFNDFAAEEKRQLSEILDIDIPPQRPKDRLRAQVRNSIGVAALAVGAWALFRLGAKRRMLERRRAERNTNQPKKSDKPYTTDTKTAKTFWSGQWGKLLRAYKQTACGSAEHKEYEFEFRVPLDLYKMMLEEARDQKWTSSNGGGRRGRSSKIQREAKMLSCLY